MSQTVVMVPPRTVAGAAWGALDSGDSSSAKRLANMLDRDDLSARHFFHGSTVFHKACSTGHLKLVDTLLPAIKSQAPNVLLLPDHVGNSPLFAAVNCAKSLPVAQRLLASGYATELHRRTNAGQLCTHAAADVGDVELLKAVSAFDPAARPGSSGYLWTLQLLQSQDNFGCSPLFVAALQGHEDVVRWLLSFPTLDVNASNRSGCTPFLAACERDHVAVVALLASDPRMSVVRVNVLGLSPFAAACRAGSAEAVKLLMRDTRIDVSRRTGEGCTPFFEAALRGQLDVVKILARSNRINVNRATRPTSWTALYGACFAGHVDVVKFLLTLPSVDVHRADSSGWSPIHVACFMGRLDIIRALHASGRVDVNSPTLHGTSGFAIACQHRNRLVVGVLLELAGEQIQPSVFFHEGRLLTYKGVPVPCPALDAMLPLEARDYTLARRRKRKQRKQQRGLGDGTPVVEAVDPVAQYLTNSIVTDAQLDVLSQQLTFIGELGLRNCANITSSGLRLVAERCRHIRKLDVRGCPNLTVLPFELAALPLEHVFVEAAAMEFPPPDVCHKGSIAVADFLRSTRSDKQEPCNVMKLVVLGGPLEGKSSFVRMVRAHDSGESHTAAVAPVGDLDRTRTADVAMWHVQWSPSRARSVSQSQPTYVDFVVYDMSGRNAALTARFGVLSHRSLFVVCVDISRWDENASGGVPGSNGSPRPDGGDVDRAGAGGGADSPQFAESNGFSNGRFQPDLRRGVTVEIDSVPQSCRPDRFLETLSLIQSHVPGARVMLVGTHLDRVGLAEGIRRMNHLLDLVGDYVEVVKARVQRRRAAVAESLNALGEGSTMLHTHLTAAQKVTDHLQLSAAWPIVGAAAVSAVTGETVTMVCPSRSGSPVDAGKRMWHQYPTSGPEPGSRGVVEAMLSAIREHMSHVLFRRSINASFLRLARMAMFDLGSSIISDHGVEEPPTGFAPITGGELFESESPLQRRMDGRAWMPLGELIDHVVVWQNCSRAKAELAIDFIAEVGLVVTVPSETIDTTVFLHPQWLFHRLHCVISRPPRKLTAHVTDCVRGQATIRVAVASDHAQEQSWTTRATLRELTALRHEASVVLEPELGHAQLPPLPTGCSKLLFRCQRQRPAVQTLDNFLQYLMTTPTVLLHPYLMKDLLQVTDHLPFAARCEGQRPPYTIADDITNFYRTGVFSNTVLKRLFRRDNNDTRNVLRVALVECGLVAPISSGPASQPTSATAMPSNIFHVPSLRLTPAGEGLLPTKAARVLSSSGRPVPRVYRWHTPIGPTAPQGPNTEHTYMRHRVGLALRGVPEVVLGHLHERWCMDDSLQVLGWDPNQGGSCHLRSAIKTDAGYEHVVVTRTECDESDMLALRFPNLVPAETHGVALTGVDVRFGGGRPTTHCLDVVAFYEAGRVPVGAPASRWRVVDCVVSDAIHTLLKWWPGYGVQEFCAVRMPDGPCAGKVFTIPAHAVRALAYNFPPAMFPAGLPYEVLGGHLPPWDSILLPSEAPDAPVTARNRAFSSSEDDDTSGVDAESLSGSDLEDSRPAGVLAPQERVELVSEWQGDDNPLATPTTATPHASPSMRAGDDALAQFRRPAVRLDDPHHRFRGAAAGAVGGAGAGAGAGASSAAGMTRAASGSAGISPQQNPAPASGRRQSLGESVERRAALAGEQFLDHAAERAHFAGRARSGDGLTSSGSRVMSGRLRSGRFAYTNHSSSSSSIPAVENVSMRSQRSSHSVVAVDQDTARTPSSAAGPPAAPNRVRHDMRRHSEPVNGGSGGSGGSGGNTLREPMLSFSFGPRGTHSGIHSQDDAGSSSSGGGSGSGATGGSRTPPHLPPIPSAMRGTSRSSSGGRVAASTGQVEMMSGSSQSIPSAHEGSAPSSAVVATAGTPPARATPVPAPASAAMPSPDVSQANIVVHVSPSGETTTAAAAIGGDGAAASSQSPPPRSRKSRPNIRPVIDLHSASTLGQRSDQDDSDDSDDSNDSVANLVVGEGEEEEGSLFDDPTYHAADVTTGIGHVNIATAPAED